MRRLPCHTTTLLSLLFAVSAWPARAEDRTFDGTNNHASLSTRGAANTPMIRFGYGSEFTNSQGGMITDAARTNARTISNALFAQSSGVASARNLSDFAWAWGQFLSHDTDLITTSNGSQVNGTAPIAVADAFDPLGPNAIPFTRANFVELTPPRGSLSGRTPVNEVTSYIDASQVYGSDAARAAALRTDGGTGAKLLTSNGGLLPLNAAGLPVENNGPIPNSEMFLAGDIRANENPLLTSLHTVFLREHNRLVDVIAAQQPALNADEQYQLARKIVGAEIQIVTYREFLPALLGAGPTVPKAEAYNYISQADPSVTTAFAHAAFRLGHSMVSPELQLVDDAGSSAGEIGVRDAFFNPRILAQAPEKVELLLKGAATQVSQEVDLLMVDDLRNFLFGPPGAGGLDLAAMNIQRGRDVGLPDYRNLALNRNISVSNFSSITADPSTAAALAAIYNNDINNVDAWVGMLAEDHVAGASVGKLLKAEIANQFQRLRDGDRLFYRSAAAGLYAGGVLNPGIAAIIDLDHLRLSDILEANTSLENLQSNVFFVTPPGDFNNDEIVDGSDFLAWQRGPAAGAAGASNLADWKAGFGTSATVPVITSVPEPSMLALAIGVCASGLATHRRRPPGVLTTS
jgi:peroxidase